MRYTQPQSGPLRIEPRFQQGLWFVYHPPASTNAPIAGLYQTSGSAPVPRVIGKAGIAANFGGASSIDITGTSVAPSSGNLTILAVVRRSASANVQTFISRNAGSSPGGFEAALYNTYGGVPSRLYANYKNAGGTQVAFDSCAVNGTLTGSNGVFDIAQDVFYTVALRGAISLTNGSNITLGSETGYLLTGDIAFAAVWDRNFSDAELQAMSLNANIVFADDDTDWLKSAGITTPTAALAWLEQNDTTALAATVTNASQLAWTEQNDTTAISAAVVGTASLAWTEANDVTAIAANVNTGGAVLSWTEQNDVTAISATVTNAGSLAWTEVNDVTAISATAITPVAGALSWTEQNDVCAIIAAAVVSGGLAWTEQNDVTAITAGTAQLVAAILAWIEQNDLAGYSSTGRAPLTPQILNQPFNNSLFLDGHLNDRNTILSGLDTVLPDQTVVNTMIVDKPIGLANQALLAIIPQV